MWLGGLHTICATSCIYIYIFHYNKDICIVLHSIVRKTDIHNATHHYSPCSISNFIYEEGLLWIGCDNTVCRESYHYGCFGSDDKTHSDFSIIEGVSGHVWSVGQQLKLGRKLYVLYV